MFGIEGLRHERQAAGRLEVAQAVMGMVCVLQRPV
jgi:hypothetical protein